MPRISTSARNLYLLALFQLVGGPLVILSVVFFSRLVAKYSEHHGVAVGVTQAWQSAEWQKVAHALTFGTAEVTVPQTKSGLPEPAPAKVKEPGGKLFWSAWTLEAFAWRQPPQEVAPTVQLPVLLSEWAQAPPLPPPRCV